MSLHINVRKITGGDIPLDIDPNKTVSELKELIAVSGKGKSIRIPALSYKGHELRDTRHLEDYGIPPGAVIQIIPPSTVERVNIQFEKEDGDRFSLSVNSDIQVNQLKREILIEEKTDAKQLKIICTHEDPEGNEVVTLKELEDDEVISTLSLQDNIVAVYTSIRETPVGPSEFSVLVSIDERLEAGDKILLGVAVKSDQTLADFKGVVLDKHSVVLSDYTLILISRELKDDQKTLEDLGFISGCTIHAVANIQFCVMTPGGEEFPMAAGAMTRLSDIRKMLQEVDTEEIVWDEFWFSLDGTDSLRETRTLWDLDVLSGTIFTLKQRRELTLKIRRKDERYPIMEIIVDEDDTFATIRNIVAKNLGYSDNSERVRLTYRSKTLSYSRTLKEEKIESGETLDFTTGLLLADDH